MRNNKGFTLVEVMIVIAIIGILVAIVVPQYVINRSRVQIEAITETPKTTIRF
ncbi:MAG: prepilin-type N-terminal cleavage/methylation domain-containing protein [Candidatus Peribacteraceae bacterium]|nr:prepilin-type N-terminal cleavage/methylation domain-containing protein [Candidatus Peribacteraceae bacterium]